MFVQQRRQRRRRRWRRTAGLQRAAGAGAGTVHIQKVGVERGLADWVAGQLAAVAIGGGWQRAIGEPAPPPPQRKATPAFAASFTAIAAVPMSAHRFARGCRRVHWRQHAALVTGAFRRLGCHSRGQPDTRGQQPAQSPHDHSSARQALIQRFLRKSFGKPAAPPHCKSS
jgi:hypothetical protein